jgi:preprotein translocase subunit SecD
MKTALMVALVIMGLCAAPVRAEVVKVFVASSEAYFDQISSQWALSIRLTPESGSDLGAFTGVHVGEKVKVRLGERTLVEPVIVEQILGGGLMIPGMESESSALQLKGEIQSRGNLIEIEGIDK